MKKKQFNYCFAVIFACLTAIPYYLKAQPVLETGGQKMPDEWIDKSTGHKIIKLTRKEGSNLSFYFHNNPFVDNKMVFYNTSPQKQEEQAKVSF